MSLTPAQVRTAMIPLVRRLLGAGHAVAGFDGIAENLGQFTVTTKTGVPLSVEMPIRRKTLSPLEVFVADAESRIRMALRPYEIWADTGAGW